MLGYKGFKTGDQMDKIVWDRACGFVSRWTCEYLGEKVVLVRYFSDMPYELAYIGSMGRDFNRPFIRIDGATNARQAKVSATKYLIDNNGVLR